MIGLDVVFPLAVPGQLIIDLRFAFEAQANIGHITVVGFTVAEIMLGVNTAVQVEFIAILIVDFSRVGEGGDRPEGDS